MLRLTVNKQDIVKPLATIQSIVDKKTIMTIINNVFIYTDENNLFLEATDLEISFKTSIPCTIHEQGAITISARKFYEIIKEFPSEEIKLDEDENNWLKIGSDERAVYRLGGFPADDFPRFRQITKGNSIELDPEKLVVLIEKTLFSASHDDSKFGLSGIFFEQQERDSKIFARMVSSDGHRLSLQETEIDCPGFREESGFIIPRKGAQEIKKLIDGLKDKILFGKDENFCFVISGNDNLLIRLVDDKFPDYRAIIPTTKERSFKFDKTSIFSALKRISILSSDSTFRGVKASIKKDIMELESLNKDLGDAKEILTVSYDGNPFEIAFNAKYMMDALMVMKSKEVEMTSNTPESPCLLTGEDDPGFLALIMPMSLVNEG